MQRNSSFCLDDWRTDGQTDYTTTPSTDALDVIDIILGLAMVVINTIFSVAFAACRKPNTENTVDKRNIHSIRMLLDFLLNMSAICIITGTILVLNGFMNIFVDERYFLCQNGIICVVKYCLVFGIFLSSTFNMLIINVERFLILVKPMVHHKIKERVLVRTMVIVIAWIVVLILSCIPLFTYNHQTKLTHCTFSETVDGYYLILLTLLFFGTVATSFSVSAYGIRTAQKHLDWLRTYTANPKQVYKTEWCLNLSVTSAIATFVFVILWLPVIIYSLYQCGKNGTCQVLKDIHTHNVTQHVLLLESVVLVPSLIWVIYFIRCPTLQTMVKETVIKSLPDDKLVITSVISVHDNKGFINDAGEQGTLGNNNYSTKKSSRLNNGGMSGRHLQNLDVIEEAVDEEH